MESKRTSNIDMKISLAFAAFAALALEESLRMPVYDDIYTAPGLFPAFLSSCIVVMCLALFLMGRRRSKLQGEDKAFTPEDASVITIERKRLFLAIGIIILYCFVLLGRTNYTLATFLFLSFMMLFFKATRLHRILIISAFVSFAISYLFEKIFLIPLP